MAKKKYHAIKLIRWYDAGFPPIDLREQLTPLIELIVYTKGLENKIKQLESVNH